MNLKRKDLSKYGKIILGIGIGKSNMKNNKLELFVGRGD